MQINLSDILSVVGREMTVVAGMEEQNFIFQGESIHIKCNTPVSVLLKHVEKDIVTVEFSAVITTSRTCSRCLDEVVSDYLIEVFRRIRVFEKEANADNSDEFDEISYIEDCTLDVDMLILDELYTVLPMNVLCREDCKGICKVCGTNLNKSTCDCDQVVPNPRMAVFSDIFNQFKEV